MTEIQQELFTGNTILACQKIKEKLLNINKNSEFYYKIIEVYAKALKKLKNFKEAIKQYKILVNKYKNEIKWYLIISEIEENINTKVDWINKAIKVDPYYSSLYNKKIEILFDDYQESIEKNESLITELYEIANRSIQINPTVDNIGWMQKLDILQKLNEKEYKKELEHTIKTLEVQEKYHPNVVIRNVELLKINNENNENVIDYIKSSIDNTISVEYEFTLLDFYVDKNNLKNIEERFEFIESKYNIDDKYLQKKAIILAEKFNRIEESLAILQSIKNKTDKINELIFTYLLYTESFDKAEYLMKNNLENKEYLHQEFYSMKGDYNEALKIVRNLLEKNKKDYTLCLSETYFLLMIGNYQEAYNLCKKYLKYSNFTDPRLLVNYYIATKKIKGSIKPDKIKEKLINNIDNDVILAAGYALINDSKNAYSKLFVHIKENNTRKYTIKNWIIFEELFKTDRFQKLLE